MNKKFPGVFRHILSKELLIIAFSLSMLLAFVRFIEFKWLLIEHSFEIYGGVIALLFTFIGVWFASKVIERKKEVVVIEKEIRVVRERADFQRDEQNIEKLGLSGRELEVLEKIAQGLSNQEIAEKLFVSVNTIKTHSANILSKLDVKRRTQAVDKAKKLSLIP